MYSIITIDSAVPVPPHKTEATTAGETCRRTGMTGPTARSLRTTSMEKQTRSSRNPKADSGRIVVCLSCCDRTEVSAVAVVAARDYFSDCCHFQAEATVSSNVRVAFQPSSSLAKVGSAQMAMMSPARRGAIL